MKTKRPRNVSRLCRTRNTVPRWTPETLTCDLYEARPITCRIFGPAVRNGGDVLGVCELNYHGATDEQIAACQVEVDPGGLEDELLEARGNRRWWRSR